ncbi:MAG: class II aldolase/adducin family protein [Polyangiaceae bacterium]|nr:class II aldolase/adducin family protein [Polyangiaceae bacterium]
MRTVIAVRDLERLLRRGEDLSSLPSQALLTPSARDLLRARGLDWPPATRVPAATAEPKAARPRASAPIDVETLFRSPEVTAQKDQICDIGQRLWHRAYVDGNGGNISVRVAEDLVLCTPTLVSKGFMKPADLCLVDMQGNQVAGVRKRTSEVLMHLAIYRSVPQAVACVHAHPPHATGFAVSGVRPPTCMVPEMELFCGEVPIAPYMTPGSPEMGEAVAALAPIHNTILMANHGVVAWGKTVEDAYFKMEILEAYCRTVLVTAQLGKPPNTIPAGQVRELLAIKQNLGIPDPRHDLQERELCDNSCWQPGVAAVAREGAAEPDQEAEALVQRITDEIMKALGG